MNEISKAPANGSSSTRRRVRLSKRPRWAATASKVLSLPITVAVVGWIVTAYINHSAVSKDYVTLAVHILQDSSQAQGQQGLRDWAVHLLNHYSAVKLDATLKSALKTGGNVAAG